ncbi:hypothetical protein TB1_010044 [Malus domestica]
MRERTSFDSWIYDKQMMSFLALLSNLFVSLVQRDEIALMVLNFFVDYRIDSKGWTSAATTLNGSFKHSLKEIFFRFQSYWYAVKEMTRICFDSYYTVLVLKIMLCTQSQYRRVLPPYRNIPLQMYMDNDKKALGSLQ